jgi:hypothetical protein
MIFRGKGGIVMSTIPDDLRYIAGELEKLKDCTADAIAGKESYTKGDFKKAVVYFLTCVIDDAIKILNDAEERIVMLEARER